MFGKKAGILGLAMLVFAVGFVLFALLHPEGSFPWSNAVTYTIYGIYCVVMAVLLAGSLRRK